MSRQLEEPSWKNTICRNVHLYHNDGHILGGIYQNGCLTQQNLYNMSAVFLIVTADWRIFTMNTDGSTGVLVDCNQDKLLAGKYIILSPECNAIDVGLTCEDAPRRVITRAPSSGRQTPGERLEIPRSDTTSQAKYFRDQVRTRDNHCMISGTQNPESVIGSFVSFEAVHVFPVAGESTWIRNHYSSWITDNTSAKYIGHTKIHSPQNGLLLQADVHQLFDAYLVSVNPDNSYKVVCFRRNDRLDGRTLDTRCLVPRDDRVSDDCLRWHFHQSILANMKGAGQNPWEMMPHDEETIEDIMALPDGATRVETELFNRLGAGDLNSPEMESH